MVLSRGIALHPVRMCIFCGFPPFLCENPLTGGPAPHIMSNVANQDHLSARSELNVLVMPNTISSRIQVGSAENNRRGAASRCRETRRNSRAIPEQ